MAARVALAIAALGVCLGFAELGLRPFFGSTVKQMNFVIPHPDFGLESQARRGLRVWGNRIPGQRVL